MAEKGSFWRRLISGQYPGRGFENDLIRAKHQLEEGERLKKAQEEAENRLKEEREKWEKEREWRAWQENQLREWQEFFDKNISPVKGMVDKYMTSLARATWGRSKEKFILETPERDKVSSPVWEARTIHDGYGSRDRYQYYSLSLVVNGDSGWFLTGRNKTGELSESSLGDLLKQEFLKGPLTYQSSYREEAGGDLRGHG